MNGNYRGDGGGGQRRLTIWAAENKGYGGIERELGQGNTAVVSTPRFQIFMFPINSTLHYNTFYLTGDELSRISGRPFSIHPQQFNCHGGWWHDPSKICNPYFHLNGIRHKPFQRQVGRSVFGLFYGVSLKASEMKIRPVQVRTHISRPTLRCSTGGWTVGNGYGQRSWYSNHHQNTSPDFVRLYTFFLHLLSSLSSFRERITHSKIPDNTPVEGKNEKTERMNVSALRMCFFLTEWAHDRTTGRRKHFRRTLSLQNACTYSSSVLKGNQFCLSKMMRFYPKCVLQITASRSERILHCKKIIVEITQ